MHVAGVEVRINVGGVNYVAVVVDFRIEIGDFRACRHQAIFVVTDGWKENGVPRACGNGVPELEMWYADWML